VVGLLCFVFYKACILPNSVSNIVTTVSRTSKTPSVTVLQFFRDRHPNWKVELKSRMMANDDTNWQPVVELLRDDIVDEEKKFSKLDMLAKKLNTHPLDGVLLFKYAVVALQCGYYVDALVTANEALERGFWPPIRSQSIDQKLLFVKIIAAAVIPLMHISESLYLRSVLEALAIDDRSAHSTSSRSSTPTLGDSASLFTKQNATAENNNQSGRKLLLKLLAAIVIENGEYDLKRFAVLSLKDSYDLLAPSELNSQFCLLLYWLLGIWELTQELVKTTRSGVATLSRVKLRPQLRESLYGDRHPVIVKSVVDNYVDLKRGSEDILFNVRVVPVVDPEERSTMGPFRMIAKRNIRSGEVFFVEKPIVSIHGNEGTTVYSKAEDNIQICSYCWKPVPSSSDEEEPNSTSQTRYQCQLCGERYCSKLCLDKANQHTHSVLCEARGSGWSYSMNMCYSDHTKRSLSDFHHHMFLVLKLMVMAHGSETYPSRWDIVRILASCRDNIGNTLSELFGLDSMVEFYDDFCMICPSLTPFLSMREALELFLIVQRDALISGDGRMSGLYALASFVNHCCLPNTQVILDGNNSAVQFTALVNIVEGEEITMSYVGNSCSIKDQRQRIKEICGFDCCCRLCKALKYDNLRSL
jgi:hypothetical protein